MQNWIPWLWMIWSSRPPLHHTAIAPMATANGTPEMAPQQWNSMAPSNGTPPWHPAIAPHHGPHKFANGIQRWHPTMALHPLPKSQPQPPTIGSKNPYSSRHLGNNPFPSKLAFLAIWMEINNANGHTKKSWLPKISKVHAVMCVKIIFTISRLLNLVLFHSSPHFLLKELQIRTRDTPTTRWYRPQYPQWAKGSWCF